MARLLRVERPSSGAARASGAGEPAIASDGTGRSSSICSTVPSSSVHRTGGALMADPQILKTGLVVGESARWHDDRLWLANWGAQEVLALDLDGNSEVMARVPTTLPISIDWLPDGRL